MPSDTNKRLKIASASIEGSTLTLRCYSEPSGDDTPQTVVSTITRDTSQLPDSVRTQLCTLGYARQIEQRYNRGGDFPHVADIDARVWASMQDGTWQLGRGGAAESEPTDLELALAEATNTPIHVVQQRFEEDVVRYPSGHPKQGEPILDAKNRTRRYFDKPMRDRLAEQPRIKVVLARIAAERAKRLAIEARAHKGDDDSLVDGLFPSDRTEPAEAAQ